VHGKLTTRDKKKHDFGSWLLGKIRNDHDSDLGSVLGVKQTQAGDMTKAQTETFVQYAISKYAALRKAYPTANEESHISRIRAKLDFGAASYCRERFSFDGFRNELKSYDELMGHRTGSSAVGSSFYIGGNGTGPVTFAGYGQSYRGQRYTGQGGHYAQPQSFRDRSYQTPVKTV
jgi:hypothetical protein